MYEIPMELESLCPYLQNKPKDREFILGKDGKWVEKPLPTVKRESVDPEDAGYHDDKGYYIPSRQIWAAGRDSSGQIQLGKSKLNRLSKFYIATIRIEPDRIYIGKKRPDEIYNKPCFKDSKKGGEMVYNPRPMFNSWKAKIKIIVLEDSIPEEKVEECFVYAGLYKGIGSRAPEFGRFRIIK